MSKRVIINPTPPPTGSELVPAPPRPVRSPIVFLVMGAVVVVITFFAAFWVPLSLPRSDSAGILLEIPVKVVLGLLILVAGLIIAGTFFALSGIVATFTRRNNGGG